MNQAVPVTQPEAAAPVRESDGAFKFTLVSHIEEHQSCRPDCRDSWKRSPCRAISLQRSAISEI